MEQVNNLANEIFQDTHLDSHEEESRVDALISNFKDSLKNINSSTDSNDEHPVQSERKTSINWLDALDDDKNQIF